MYNYQGHKTVHCKESLTLTKIIYCCFAHHKGSMSMGSQISVPAAHPLNCAFSPFCTAKFPQSQLVLISSLSFLSYWEHSKLTPISVWFSIRHS